MFTFKQLLTFAYDSEYESAYDLSKKKQFSLPKIYNANNDLKKRWYIYFSFRDPHTGHLKRQTPIYGDANTYKTKEERLAVLSAYRKVLLDLLRKGFNPYQDNAELYNEHKQNSIKSIIIPEQSENETVITVNNQAHTTKAEAILSDKENKPIKATLKKAFGLDMETKKETLRTSSMRSYSSHIKIFREWISNNHPEINYIEQVNKSLVVSFLLYILTKTSPRNRNNYRTSLSSLFSTLEEHELVNVNFVKKIKVYKANPKRNKSYTNTQQHDIFDYLETEDPLLLLFIKFVSFNLLRPIEVCRLRIEDINIENRTLSFKAKNSEFKTKIIPEILWKELPDLTQFKREDFLFTPKGFGGDWKGTGDAKRNYFSKRFKKVVKDKFSLGEDYGMYSFRHTYITKLYKALVIDSSPYAAKSKLMQITGHSSMKALEQYLRSIDAELPEDYSKMIIN